MQARWDAIVVGGGHNGLAAAAYLARAGKRVVVLERLDELGGAVVSQRPFTGVDARLSRFSYLVALLPARIREELGLRLELRRRTISSYSPEGDGGLLVRHGEHPAPAGAQRLADRVWPTLLEPLRSADAMRELVEDDEAWERLTQQPLGTWLRDEVDSDLERGVVLTDGLIGQLSSADDADLRQNVCFLYHLLHDWDVPVGGMGAVSAELARVAREAGAELRTGAEVASIDADDAGGEVRLASGERLAARHVLANVAPRTLGVLLGGDPGGVASLDGAAREPEGAQLKVNLLVERLPRLRDTTVEPHDAFAGTFHVHESLAELEAACAAARAGRLPDPVPCELYCHSLADPSILGPALRGRGVHTLTVFALHLPERLFTDHGVTREQALDATLRSLDSVLAEPLAPLLVRDAEGRPCVEAKTPLDLEAELGLPGGHIFHRDLRWPWAEREDEVGTWGVETERAALLLCGAGARRGGGVSAIPGRNAAMAVLGEM